MGYIIHRWDTTQIYPDGYIHNAQIRQRKTHSRSRAFFAYRFISSSSSVMVAIFIRWNSARCLSSVFNRSCTTCASSSSISRYDTISLTVFMVSLFPIFVCSAIIPLLSMVSVMRTPFLFVRCNWTISTERDSYTGFLAKKI